MNNEWKYQVSKTDGKGGIYVARSNDSLEDCVLDLEKIMVIKAEKESVEVSKSVNIDHFCVKHNIQMKEREFNGKKWYDHRRKLDDGTWEKCSGISFPSELRQAVDNSFAGKEEYE